MRYRCSLHIVFLMFLHDFCIYLNEYYFDTMRHKLTAIAAVTVLLAAACGNSHAQKKETLKDNVKGTVTELTSKEFSTKVYDMTKEELVFLSDRPAVVDFNATWCGPCRRIAPILDELAAEYKGKVDIYKVDVDKNPELAKAFNITSIPAILYIPVKGEARMVVGAGGKEDLKKQIEAIL